MLCVSELDPVSATAASSGDKAVAVVDGISDGMDIGDDADAGPYQEVCLCNDRFAKRQLDHDLRPVKRHIRLGLQSAEEAILEPRQLRLGQRCRVAF